MKPPPRRSREYVLFPTRADAEKLSRVASHMPLKHQLKLSDSRAFSRLAACEDARLGGGKRSAHRPLSDPHCQRCAASRRCSGTSHHPVRRRFRKRVAYVITLYQGARLARMDSLVPFL